MRALVTLVTVMGVLIILGVVTIAVTIVHRLSEPALTAGAETLLEEPMGTRMAAVAASGNRLAVVLSGGGPDRLLLIDPQSGKVVGRLALAR